ncbi:hypothetical protein [Actinomadura rubrisoli]|uniref:hypothetical protein n=1 Tax=Actinomadura rubrisoli TaxID=2530368 RepID=UPI0014049C19|nr:hypothetical protein [Actinomadura rubrisoli]
MTDTERSDALEARLLDGTDQHPDVHLPGAPDEEVLLAEKYGDQDPDGVFRGEGRG